MVVTPEQLHRRVMMALARLSDLALTQQQWDKVALLTMQQLALDPWREEAYRQLMHALASKGNEPKRWLSLNSAGRCYGRRWAWSRCRKQLF